jgi:hypothetical protein
VIRHNLETVEEGDEGDLNASGHEDTEPDNELSGLGENDVHELRELESQLAERKARVFKVCFSNSS